MCESYFETRVYQKIQSQQIVYNIFGYKIVFHPLMAEMGISKK